MYQRKMDDEKEPLFGYDVYKKKTKSNPFSYGSIKTTTKEKDKIKPDKEVKKIPLLKLFRFATPMDRLIIFVGTISSVVHGAGFPLLALVFGSMTDTFITASQNGFSTNNGTESVEGSTNSTSVTREEFAGFMADFALYYVYIGLIVLVSSLIQSVCWEWACERQVFRLRQEFFYQVLRQEISWYDEHQTGDLAIKLSDDLERVREGIGHKFSMVIQFISTFVAGFVVGFLTSWQMTLVILAITPLLAGTSAFTGRMIATQSSREQQKYGKAGGVAEEVLSSIRTVSSFGGERREIERYENSLMDGLKIAIQKYHVYAIGIALVFLIMYASYALAFWYGCELLQMKLLTPGAVFTVFFSSLVGAFSLGNAIPFVSIIAIAQGSGAVVFEVIDSIPKIDPYSKKGLMPARVEGRIQFCNIDFNYPSRPDVDILKKFTIDIAPGKTVAVVGPSGAGKSTIVSLLMRFYDPSGGSILIDGNDTRSLNLAWLRHHIGVVSQEPVLFGTSIYENIRYGREDVCPDEIMTAARMANAHDFISSLPQGYDTLVGERGAQLSGGQKQRVAIARALVRDPRILLLDEATSALDAKSESVVQDALNRARKGRTTIIIAHRLSTIKDADCIYAIQDGLIAESGTHNQLMAKEGLYAHLVTAQTSETFDEYSNESTFESADDSTRESKDHEESNKVKKLKKRKKRLELPDPDKARLAREVAELNVKYPGLIKIFKVNKPEWLLLVLGLIGCAICGAITPFFAFFYAEMFETFTKTGDELRAASFFWSMMFVALAVLSGVGFWLRTIFVASAGEYLTMRLRLLSYIGILRQPIGWFDNETNTPSRLTTRLARDAPLVKAAAGHRIGIVVTSLVTIITAFFIAFYFGWELALVLSIGFPILIVAGYIQIQVQKAGQKKDAAIMEDAGRMANESIGNIRTVQSLSGEKLFFEQYLAHLAPSYSESHKQGVIYGAAFSFSEAAIFVIYAAAFRYGAYLVEVDTMEPIDVYRVFFAIAFCAVAVGQTTSFVADYTKARLAAALIFNLVELESDIDPFGPEGLRVDMEGRISFHDVTFRYPSRIDVPVLQGLSFDLSPGKTLALVGHSGCGKSTVVSLLERFYDVHGGSVRIDGIDVRSINVRHLRSQIGLVTQEPTLFDTTIFENIAYGHGDGTAEVEEHLVFKAAKEANIHDFIISLPNGYETIVGERGTLLSGGQKQRIAIARALIRNPKILLLDEATSALDQNSEKVVQEALDKARTGRTCIMVAHRLSTIQNADCIAVLSGGRIVEAGTHDQLREKKGIYYRLTKKQQIH